jgi:hypothetical protein
MSNNFAPLSPGGAQQMTEALETEQNKARRRMGIGVLVFLGAVLSGVAGAALLPVAALFPFYGILAVAGGLVAARTVGEEMNVSNLYEMKGNTRTGDFEAKMLRRNDRFRMIGHYARMGGIALAVLGAVVLPTGGLAVGLEVMAAALLCESTRQYLAGSLRSAQLLEDKLEDIRVEEAMITPHGSGEKFRRDLAKPGFNSAAAPENTAETAPSVETEHTISVGKPLTLKKAAAL